MTGQGKPNRPGKTVEKSFEIVQYIDREGPSSLSELDNELDITKSTIHRHLDTLQSKQLVVKEDDEYRLGYRFLYYGVSTRENTELYAAAKSKVDKLASSTGERVWCMIEENGLGVLIYGSGGENAVRTYAQTGSYIPLHQTAGGKSILAHLDDSRVTDILDHHGLPQRTENTITSREQLLDELAEIRDRGIAFNHEESVKGLHGISVPVVDETGDGVLGAMSIIGPANRLSEERSHKEFSRRLSGAVNEIEINLAYS